ncbi:MAG: hypothetical protein IPK93_10250 [Solirubrobacterales bacterium]|nr:hypothetical protein [Solirubrobacterales bacterium]
MTSEHTDELLLAITEQAFEKVMGFRAQSDIPEDDALWVAVSGTSGGKYVYKIFLSGTGAVGPVMWSNSTST